MFAVTGAYAQGRTYYVSTGGSDGNPGTQTAPWRTIAHAATMLQAGDTAVVADGNYTESYIYFHGNSGTPTSPITIRAANKHGAVINSTSGCYPAIDIFASYVTIDGLRFAGGNCAVNPASPSSFNAAIWCEASDNNTFPSASNPNSMFRGCTIRNVLIDQSANRCTGIKTVQDYAVVEDSEIHASLEAFDSYGVIYRNNTIYWGDAWGSYLYGKGGVRALQIYNNVVHANYQDHGAISPGIGVGGSGSPTPKYDSASGIEAYNSVAYNNVIHVSGTPTGSGNQVLGFASAVNSAIVNNVVVGGARLFMLPGTYSSIEAYTSNATFLNNILDCAGRPATDAAGGNWKNAGSLNLDYNHFSNCTGAPTQTHSVSTGSPQFVDVNGDFHLQSGSPDIGAGTAMPSFTGDGSVNIDISKDREGSVRTSPWDLGVYKANAGSTGSGTTTGGGTTSGSGSSSGGATSSPSTAGSISVAATSPASGSGLSQTFVFSISDNLGAGDISDVNVLINGAFTTANSCWLHFFPGGASLSLSNDSGGWQSNVALGTAGASQSNNQCSINIAGASVSSSGNTLKLSVPITFNASWAGAKTEYVFASGQSGATAAYAPVGSWTVASAGSTTGSTVSLAAASPSSGSGVKQTFTFTVSDSAGYAKLVDINVMINSALTDGTNACWLHYYGPSNSLALANDKPSQAPAWQTDVRLGTATTLKNSQCTIDLAGATAAGSGTSLKLTVPITFNSAWTGTKNIYAYAGDADGITAGYTAVGSWAISASDTTAPSTPNGLATTAISASQVNLTWSSSTDNVGVSGYRVYRNGTQIATVTSGRYFQDTGLTAATKYTYTVAAYDASGNVSSQSASSSATTAAVSTAALRLNPTSPSIGSGRQQTITFTVYDAKGASSISDINVLIDSTLTGGSNSCWFHYFAPTKSFQLSYDTLGWQPTVPLGTNLVQQNSQCSVNLAGATATASGNTLVLTVPITFATSWTGVKTIYTYAGDSFNNTAGYSPVASWIVN